MSRATKQIAVVVCCRQRERVAEALRAAVGLCLRGDEVSVVFAQPDARAGVDPEPAAAKALATLEILGRRVDYADADADALADVVARADAVEVWT
jgi:hypothetical protein